MELSSILGTLLSEDSVKTMSKSTKADSSQVQDVVSLALPYLMKGISTQAEDKSTSASLLEALSSHGQKDTSNIGSFLGHVDTADGAKIIGHLLGANKDKVTNDIAKKSGMDAEQVINLLVMAAPLIMSLVGQQTAKTASSKTTPKAAAKPAAKTADTAASKSGSGIDGEMATKLVGQVLGELLKGT